MHKPSNERKKPYEKVLVGTGVCGFGYGGIEISADGIVYDCFCSYGADEIAFSNKAKVICEGVVQSAEDSQGFGLMCNTLRIPANIEEIEPGAFANLEEVYNVVVEEDNPNYKAVDNVIFTKDGKTLIYCPPNKADEVPEGTEIIAYRAFCHAEVNSITIPESVTEIETCAFTESYVKEIRGVAGSYAEEYAEREGFLFVNVDERNN